MPETEHAKGATSPGSETSEQRQSRLARLAHKLNPSVLASKLGTVAPSTALKHDLDDDAMQGRATQKTADKHADKEVREQRIADEARRIAEQRAREDAEAAAAEDAATRARYGALDAEHFSHPGEIVRLEDVARARPGDDVTFRARIMVQRNVSARLDFLLFRQQLHTLQGVLGADEHITRHLVKWVQRLPVESIVQVSGRVQEPKEPVKSATIKNLEVHVESVHLISAAHDLPFDLYHGHESVHSRLTNRVVDLREPSNQAIFRVRSKIMQVWRRSLDELGFIEISTPKLQPAATESGAEVFKVNYFGRTAFLAQSPQLAKQMAISADFGKVFEVGPVFRAENSNTHRHLTEYTGLDLEMAITKDYHEVVATLVHVLRNIFFAVYEMKDELARIAERFPAAVEPFELSEEIPVIPFSEGIRMLREDGRDVEEEDLSTRDEIRLGELVKAKYHTDFYVLDRFPVSARPFYTYIDGNYTNSFDMFVRGQEVCTGGQRIHEADKLRARMRDAGIQPETMTEYMQAFDWATPPHAGAGLGLERIVFLLLNLGNVRFASLFHRDPKSLPPVATPLPHPEASTLRHHDELPPVEDLIANYGDATNTSWLDDRFEVWRDPQTGAAVGYVRQDKFAMITGDPLCDHTQYGHVIGLFLEYVRDTLKLTPIWMLVGEEVQEILANRLGWRTLTCVEEQRLEADKAKPIDPQKVRHVEREGVEFEEVKPDDEIKAKVDKKIEEWKASRTDKKQVHLTEVQPWRDERHRRYFLATKNGEPQAMVVLAQLSPQHGWQAKWCLDLPGSVNGAIEVLVSKALAAIPGSKVTFGAGVSAELIPKHGLGGVRAKALAKSYSAIVQSLKLNAKSEFRSKFGTYGEPIYLCFPKRGINPANYASIIKFFED
ncbi:aspartate--tRNA ligase dps1 [Cryptotrichosporon argae]